MVEKVMSATEARVHFGEVMRNVSERDEIVIVERDGSPKIAIISIEQLEKFRLDQKENEGGIGSSVPCVLASASDVRSVTNPFPTLTNSSTT